MEYFNLLEFKKEPFSNSPEPEFLYVFPQQSSCLQRLELACRLRRGLNIVIGPVGAGKTTLCRKLIQNLSLQVANDATVIETFLLLDPAVSGTYDFVKTVAAVLGVTNINADDHEWQIKEKIKTFLFDQGVQQKKNIVLIIDEGQKIPENCLEILREFLNYETNSYKLLQIVIFAQPEFREHLDARANLLDRVNYLHYLKPLSFWQMKVMVEHRISVASIQPDRSSLISFGGMIAIYAATGGYPRKVVSLCHQVLLLMIIRRCTRADWFLVRSCIKSRQSASGTKRISWAMAAMVLIAGLSLASAFYWKGTDIKGHFPNQERLLSGIDMKMQAPSVTNLPVAAMPVALQTGNAVETIPDAHQNQDQPRSEMPDRLGEIVIKKRMTFWWLMENIYGETGRELTEKMILVNPHVKDINDVYYGITAKVPLISEKTHWLKPETIIVALDKSTELEKIYYSFIEKKDMNSMPPMLFLSLWNKREGRQFIIALNQTFKSKDEAGEAIRRLPSEFAGSARVLSQWDGDTVYLNSRFMQ